MGFFQKIRKEGTGDSQEQVQLTTEPKFSHLVSYQSVQRRALIGWVVSRCAAALKLDELDREALFLKSFEAISFEELEDGLIKELMQLADSLVDWIRANAVIEEEMKAIHPEHISKDVLTRVFSEIQADVKFDDLQPIQKENAWEVYRDVIYASTHGSFLLIAKNEIKKYQQGEQLCSVKIVNREDVPKARNTAKEVFTDLGLSSSKVMSYNLIISEAVTNILKHAEHGEMTIYRAANAFHVIISDKGPGFPLKILPKTTLMAGFSTKESLGQGFTLMMKMAKQVVLETSETGSTLILILEAGGDEHANEK
ncbi:ATP-binding protein [Ornithinibacillus contaminans]|uniref:ATP-binding protein n=1 Tax=Ornithinibacillus contaminans TaxID=694055 RepID=UPI00064D9C83|nr:ATP-binding protein [Ornithinibacillus contaminans]